jgi:hypothetical protein
MGYSLRGFLRQAITAGGTHPYPAAMPQTRQMHMSGQNKGLPHARGTLPLHTLHLPLVQQHLNSLHMQDLHGGPRSSS